MLEQVFCYIKHYDTLFTLSLKRSPTAVPATIFTWASFFSTPGGKVSKPYGGSFGIPERFSRVPFSTSKVPLRWKTGLWFKYNLFWRRYFSRLLWSEGFVLNDLIFKEYVVKVDFQETCIFIACVGNEIMQGSGKMFKLSSRSCFSRWDYEKSRKYLGNILRILKNP